MDSNILSRFWKKVDKSSLDGCWEWTGAIKPNGYGTVWTGTTDGLQSAHRFSWQIHFGKIPHHPSSHGMCVCHRCDNRSCVNPEHLFIGTHTDNMKDMFNKHRRKVAKGMYAGNSTLNESDVLKIRSLAGQMMQKDIASLFGVSGHAIYSIMKRRTWKHI